VSIGENVKRLRIAAGLMTQKALAERMGAPQPRVSDIENDRYGKDGPTLPTLREFAVALGCQVADIVANTKYENLVDGAALRGTVRRIRDDDAVPSVSVPARSRRATRNEKKARELFDQLSGESQSIVLGILESFAKQVRRRAREPK
jgi:transcriptional regulator with XRE-family HTH domain